MYSFIISVCVIRMFDFKVWWYSCIQFPVSVTLNNWKICQVALTCCDEIEQLISNNHAAPL